METEHVTDCQGLWEAGKRLFNGSRVAFSRDGNVPELGGGDGCMTTDVLNVTELHVSKW